MFYSNRYMCEYQFKLYTYKYNGFIRILTTKSLDMTLWWWQSNGRNT